MELVTVTKLQDYHKHETHSTLRGGRQVTRAHHNSHHRLRSLHTSSNLYCTGLDLACPRLHTSAASVQTQCRVVLRRPRSRGAGAGAGLAAR